MGNVAAVTCKEDCVGQSQWWVDRSQEETYLYTVGDQRAGLQSILVWLQHSHCETSTFSDASVCRLL